MFLPSIVNGKHKTLRSVKLFISRTVFVTFTFLIFIVAYGILIAFTVVSQYTLKVWLPVSLINAIQHLWVSTVIFAILNATVFVCRLIMKLFKFNKGPRNAIIHFFFMAIGILAVWLGAGVVSLTAKNNWEIYLAIGVSVVTVIISFVIALIIYNAPKTHKSIRAFVLRGISSINIGIFTISLFVFAVTAVSPGSIKTIFETVTLFILAVFFTIEIPMVFLKVVVKNEDGENEYYLGWSVAEAVLDVFAVTFMQMYSIFAMTIYINLNWVKSAKFPFIKPGAKPSKDAEESSDKEKRETQPLTYVNITEEENEEIIEMGDFSPLIINDDINDPLLPSSNGINQSNQIENLVL